MSQKIRFLSNAGDQALLEVKNDTKKWYTSNTQTEKMKSVYTSHELLKMNHHMDSQEMR